MEFDKTYYDFIDRTETNLRLIEEYTSRGNDKAYEVTQLINSLLGLIVLPKEKELVKASDLLLELSEQGWVFPVACCGTKNPRTLPQLVRHIRHGIAHWNIDFISAPDKTLSGVRITNNLITTKKGKKNITIEWAGEFTVETMRRFVKRLAALAKERAANLK